MEYIDYNCGPYNLHLIKTDRFKTVHMEVIFRSNVTKEKAQKRTILCDLLTDCSKKYPTKKDIVIKSEELYKTVAYGSTSKTGNILSTIFVSEFLAPKYITDKKYYENVLDFIFGLITKPNVTNKEFNLKMFNIAKEKLKIDIESVSENPVKLGIRNIFKKACPNNATSIFCLGELDTLEDINPSNLYLEYEEMLKNDICDIFIIGDIPTYETEKLIKSRFNLRTIKNHSLDMYIDNKYRFRPLKASDKSNFVQSSLDLLFNTSNLERYEKNIVFSIYNYILGSGGMTSKLYQNVRENNSLCYSIGSMYLKYDRLLLIQVSLDNCNVRKAIKLIKKCVKDMASGKFSEEEIEDAKKNIINSIEMSLDNNVSILNNYVFQIFDDATTFEERKKLIKSVSKQDVIKVAKKVKLNTIYCLKGVADGKD